MWNRATGNQTRSWTVILDTQVTTHMVIFQVETLANDRFPACAVNAKGRVDEERMIERLWKFPSRDRTSVSAVFHLTDAYQSGARRGSRRVNSRTGRQTGPQIQTATFVGVVSGRRASHLWPHGDAAPGEAPPPSARGRWTPDGPSLR